MALPIDLPLYGALGNDFYLFEGDYQPSVNEVADLCQGANGRFVDGLLLLSVQETGHRVTILNADGSNGGLSGNGLRCAAYHLSLSHRELNEPYLFHTAAGVVEASLLAAQEVQLLFRTLSTCKTLPLPSHISKSSLEAKLGCSLENLWLVDIGNPHLILDLGMDFLERLEGANEELDELRKSGSVLDGGVNVSLLSRSKKKSFDLRVFERGVGATKACGSAAIACFLLLIELGLAPKVVTFVQPGGPLTLECAEKGLLLTGAVYKNLYLGAILLLSFRGSIGKALAGGALNTNSITTRFLILLGGGTFLFFILFLVLNSFWTAEHSEEMAFKQAELALEMELAVRSYVGSTIRPEYTSRIEPGKFCPEVMSTSFVARRVFEQVKKKQNFASYRLTFAAENPRNPINKARKEDLSLIQYFRTHPKAKRKRQKIVLNGREYAGQFNARRANESCLQCHGETPKRPQGFAR